MTFSTIDHTVSIVHTDKRYLIDAEELHFEITEFMNFSNVVANYIFSIIEESSNQELVTLVTQIYGPNTAHFDKLIATIESEVKQPLLKQKDVNTEGNSHSNINLSYVAAQDDMPDLLQKICDNKTENINSLNENRASPLHISIKNHHNTCSNILLQNGATPMITHRDNDGETPIWLAAYYNNVAGLTLLLRYGEKYDLTETINDHNLKGETPLCISATWNNTSCMALLLKNGAIVDKMNNDHVTPLYLAAYCGNTESVKLLLTHKADINMKCHSNTPLMAACSSNRTEQNQDLFAELLVGGDQLLAKNNNQTALDIAVDINNVTAIIEFLKFFTKNPFFQWTKTLSKTSLEQMKCNSSKEITTLLITLDLREQNSYHTSHNYLFSTTKTNNQNNINQDINTSKNRKRKLDCNHGNILDFKK